MINTIEFQKKWPGDIKRKFYFPTRDELEMLTSSKEEQDFVLATGIPLWSAPNIHLHSIETTTFPDFLKIGEDRDANIIVVNSKTKTLGWGNASGNEGFGYLSASIVNFLIELYHYQCMVSEALEKAGEDAFISNKIPKALIQEFIRKIQKECKDSMLAKNAFWKKETERILNRG
jgi:hypothetical protein